MNQNSHQPCQEEKLVTTHQILTAFPFIFLSFFPESSKNQGSSLKYNFLWMLKK
jgi:hypothetical protein